MHLRDEVLQHFFSDLEIGDDTVFQGTDRLNVTRRSTQHTLGFFTNGLNRLLTVVNSDSYHGGLVKNNSSLFDVDKGISSTEVDRHIGGEHPSEAL